ncbi:hypothetical protein CWR48_03710 [Oceanobacillus arenosus]|uniref:Calcineurin-like phosphoesterase domain-containing protein n=1 Tax=Oceanobacillus arenosus TaxID=1229153 RepID=A0A3D8PZR8_9BACI|nr:hypothetical protein [Oceanobacillus arenosus]RDW21077.1 hypothetical protein CWR48_03710 [Oceanobacillus arenosus]
MLISGKYSTAFRKMKDKLIIGGDMINYGPERSADVLEWIKERTRSYLENNLIMVGNHEEMMICS